MNLIEEIKEASDQAFNTWFDRWFEKNKFTDVFKKSAQQGYSSYSIELRRTTPLSDSDKYLNRRLRDPRTVAKLKKKLPSIDIKFIEQEKSGFFSLTYTTEKLIFRWGK